MFKQYDYVSLKEGLLGCLIEDFGDGVYLFEFPTPDGANAFNSKFVRVDEIEKAISQDVVPNPYAIG